jgi:hypothetical protein
VNPELEGWMEGRRGSATLEWTKTHAGVVPHIQRIDCSLSSLFSSPFTSFSPVVVDVFGLSILFGTMGS